MREQPPTPPSSTPEGQTSALRRLFSIVWLWLALLGLLTVFDRLRHSDSWPKRLAEEAMLLLAPLSTGVLVLLAAPALYFLTIGVQELGSQIGGGLMGLRLDLLVIGPLKLERTAQRLRVGLNRSTELAGGVSMRYATRSDNVPQALAALLIGGPLAGLIAGVLALAASLLLSEPLFWVVLVFGGFNLLVTFILLQPQSSQGSHSHGTYLLQLRGGGRVAERRCAVMTLEADARTQRPGEWSEELLAVGVSVPDQGSDDFEGRILAYKAGLDRAADAALEHMSYMLEHIQTCPVYLRPTVLLEAAYFTARQGDPADAREYLEQARGGVLAREHILARAEAAVLLAEGQPALAADLAHRGLVALQLEEQTALAMFEADMLRDLEQRCRETQRL